MKRLRDRMPVRSGGHSRREFLARAAATAVLGGTLGGRLRANDAQPVSIETIRAKTLDYVERMRVEGEPYGRYRYAEGMPQPTLYSSAYAAMTRDLYNDLGDQTEAQRRQWIEYLQSHQDDDGLFRDPLIFGQGWYRDDPEWCGRRHLTCHVVTALTSLGAAAAKPMRFLDPFLEPGGLVKWLESRGWRDQTDIVGNEVLNVGTLLQYARDFQKNERCGPALKLLLEWMTQHHMDARYGLWGSVDPDDLKELSRAVQAAYHFWLLYFYDKVPIPYAKRAVDQVLRTQNSVGGFGQGVHNGGCPTNSSACEDIDSIDPLCRLLVRMDYRREDIRRALERGLARVLVNQNPDGGFVFMRDTAFTYGHPLLAAGHDQSGMFPTWFRTLTLAYLGKALPHRPIGSYPWRFCNCPGIQFWIRDAHPRPPR